MTFTFSNNPIDKIRVWLMNKHEKYTHYVFNRKPQYVKCKICGDILSSRIKETPSPEECGWKQIDHWWWICHRCDAHRYFKPYIKLVDEFEVGKYYLVYVPEGRPVKVWEKTK